MHSHSRESTGTTRLIHMQRRSRVAILLNMQSHSREATVMSRRRGVAASTCILLYRMEGLRAHTVRILMKMSIMEQRIIEHRGAKI